MKCKPLANINIFFLPYFRKISCLTEYKEEGKEAISKLAISTTILAHESICIYLYEIRVGTLFEVVGIGNKFLYNLCECGVKITECKAESRPDNTPHFL